MSIPDGKRCAQERSREEASEQAVMCVVSLLYQFIHANQRIKEHVHTEMEDNATSENKTCTTFAHVALEIPDVP